MAWEFALLDWLQTLHSPAADACMTMVTFLGNAGWFFIVLGIVLTCCRRTRRCGVTVLAALAMGALLCNLTLKPLAARARPCWLRDAVQMLVAVPKDYSFPSGHSQASFATATAVFGYHRRWGIALYVLAALIAFSRLYLYVHFPTDVLVGMAIGICMGWLAKRLLECWEKKKGTEA